MRLTTVILIATLMQVSAHSLAQKITLLKNKAQLKTILQDIRKQSGYNFVYTDVLLEKASPVTINVKEVELNEVLEQVFDQQPLTYEMNNKTVVLKEKAPTFLEGLAERWAAIDVRGVVRNEKGEALEGITVTIKGTNRGTTTNVKGEFFLNNVDEKATLVFSGINIETYEVKVKGKESMTVNVRIKQVQLTEVTINTGYQKISKEKFVGSYVQLDSAAFHSQPGAGIIERLDGRVTGVVFDKKGGAGALFPIKIRGISTLAQEDPALGKILIILDNFPVGPGFDINSINPNDIESINVLKDAVASSIWGSSAGNGVIVITTKKARYNRELSLNFSSNVKIEPKPNLYRIPRISISDFIDIEKDLFAKGYYDTMLDDRFSYFAISPAVEILDRYKRGEITSWAEADHQIDAFRNQDVRKDYDRFVYRNAINQQHYLNFSGGNNTLAYQLSGGYNRSLNNIQHSKADEQYTLQSTAGFKPLKDLEIKADVNLSINKIKSGNFGFSEKIPYQRFADDNGNALATSFAIRQGYIDTVGNGRLLDWNYRPLDEIKLQDVENRNQSLLLNLGLVYKINKWLKADVSYRYSGSFQTAKDYRSLQSYSTRDLINRLTNFSQDQVTLRYPVPMGGILSLNNSNSYFYNFRGSLNFDHSWNNKHVLNAMAVAETSDSKGGYESGSMVYGYDPLTGTSQPVDYVNFYPVTYPSPGQVIFISGAGGYSPNPVARTVSILANASYSYANRYQVYASARRDGKNLFGVNTNNRWKPLWSAGFGWIISNESFYHLEWLSTLKLRASYGYAGNTAAGNPGKFTIIFGSDPQRFNNLPFAYAGAAPNPDLRWEQVQSKNLALDYTLLKGRINGNIEVFEKKSTDVIAKAPLASASGVSEFVTNSASLKTKGFEINVLSENIKGKFSWITSLGFAQAKTIITEVYNRAGGYRARDFISYSLHPTKDQIAYGLSSYRWAGLDAETGDPQGYLNNQISKDYMGIGNDSIQNQVFHGSAIPLQTSFIRNAFRWKGLELAFNITGKLNYYFREPALQIFYSGDFGANNYMIEYYRRWQQKGDELRTNIPSVVYGDPIADIRSSFYQNSEINVKRGDHIRLENINLSYQWANHNKRLPFKNIQASLYASNLNIFLWKKAKTTYDPDLDGGGGGVLSIYPSKLWAMQLNLTF